MNHPLFLEFEKCLERFYASVEDAFLDETRRPLLWAIRCFINPEILGLDAYRNDAFLDAFRNFLQDTDAKTLIFPFLSNPDAQVPRIPDQSSLNSPHLFIFLIFFLHFLKVNFGNWNAITLPGFMQFVFSRMTTQHQVRFFNFVVKFKIKIIRLYLDKLTAEET